MAKKIYGQSMYLKDPHFPSYGDDYLNNSAYAVDQSFAVDTDVRAAYLKPAYTSWLDNNDQHTYQTRMAIQELESQYDYSKSRFNHMHDQYKTMRRNVELAAEAPTQKDLDDYPGLANAWEQYVIVKKLIKGC